MEPLKDKKQGPKKTIAYKIKDIIEQKDNSYLVFVSLRDEKGVWTKSLKFSSSQIIKLERVKEAIEAEVRRDLKIDNPIAELQPVVGQEFIMEL